MRQSRRVYIVGLVHRTSEVFVLRESGKLMNSFYIGSEKCVAMPHMNDRLSSYGFTSMAHNGEWPL